MLAREVTRRRCRGRIQPACPVVHDACGASSGSRGYLVLVWCCGLAPLPHRPSGCESVEAGALVIASVAATISNGNVSSADTRAPEVHPTPECTMQEDFFTKSCTTQVTLTAARLSDKSSFTFSPALHLRLPCTATFSHMAMED